MKRRVLVNLKGPIRPIEPIPADHCPLSTDNVLLSARSMRVFYTSKCWGDACNTIRAVKEAFESLSAGTSFIRAEKFQIA